MKTARVIRSGFFPLLLAANILNADRLQAQQSQIAPADADADAVKMISDYRRWKKANQKPEWMNSMVDPSLCAPPSPVAQRLDRVNPHKDKYVNVFINNVGFVEFMSKATPHFEEGTIIIKEKLTTPTNSQPELLTVMVKRKAGFNPQNGDWEYLTFNGYGTKVTARGKLESCQECHEINRDRGYVFRNYLSADVWEQMK